MRHFIKAAAMIGLFASGVAQAQTTPGTGSPGVPAAAASGPTAIRTSGSTAGAPAPGANSFTAGEARGRIEARGFANVTDLKKDDKGVWHGTAMKDGKPAQVALDYQGNVVGQ